MKCIVNKVEKSLAMAEKKRPIQDRIAVSPVYSKYSSYPSNGLDPRRLASIFREADNGDVSRQMELFEEMEEKDPHLFSQLQTRKNAVTGLDFEVVPFSDEARDKDIADFVSEQINSIKNIEDVFLDLLDAIGKGIALSEIMWGYDNGHVVIKDILPIHQKLVFWNEQDEMMLITEDEPSGVSIPQNKLIIHKYKARSGHPSRAGVLRVCAWMYLFKNYSVKDWVAFAEVYGMPLRIGKYDANASEEDQNKLMEALIRLGTDAAGMIPSTAEIKFIESAKVSSIEVYETLARYCDEQNSKAILGQTLTSDSGGGSYAQSKTHNEVRHDLTVADCKALASTLKDDLIRPLVLFNFGETSRIPSLRFDCELPEDLKQLVEILDKLVQMGVPIPLAHIYKEFGIPAPKKGEAVTSRTSVSTPLLPTKDHLIINKQGVEPENIQLHNELYQNKADALADFALSKSPPVFAKIFEPLQNLVNQSGSLEDIKNKLSDQKFADKLLTDMDNKQLEELIQELTLTADLVGRLRERERGNL